MHKPTEIIAASNDNGRIKIDNSTEADASSLFAGRQRVSSVLDTLCLYLPGRIEPSLSSFQRLQPIVEIVRSCILVHFNIVYGIVKRHCIPIRCIQLLNKRFG